MREARTPAERGPLRGGDGLRAESEEARNEANQEIADLRQTEREHRERMKTHLAGDAGEGGSKLHRLTAAGAQPGAETTASHAGTHSGALAPTSARASSSPGRCRGGYPSARHRFRHSGDGRGPIPHTCRQLHIGPVRGHHGVEPGQRARRQGPQRWGKHEHEQHLRRPEGRSRPSSPSRPRPRPRPRSTEPTTGRGRPSRPRPRSPRRSRSGTARARPPRPASWRSRRATPISS